MEPVGREDLVAFTLNIIQLAGFVVYCFIVYFKQNSTQMFTNEGGSVSALQGSWSLKGARVTFVT